MTALEIALDRAERLEVIPTITNPMGSGWKQPNRRDIVIDEKYAVMSKRNFDSLAEYSASQPSGVYEGKMWKRHNGAFDGFSDKPNHVSNNFREILLSDGELPQ